MTDDDVVIKAESLTISKYPHAASDCPNQWRSRAAPCELCFCYVCDTPVRECDDFSAHHEADGRVEKWRILKRRRSALVNKWQSVDTLVQLLVSTSCEEAAIRERTQEEIRSSSEQRRIQLPDVVCIVENESASAHDVKPCVLHK